MTWSTARGARNLFGSIVGLSAALAVFSRSAHAGHAPLLPEPRTLLLREDDPSHLVIGTRRGGYFVTRDAGATWSWMCESGVGYEDEEVYPGALLPGGTLVLSTGFGGVSSSADGCGFSAWLPSEQPFVADVRAAPSVERGVLALEARSDGDAFVNQLWQSEDGFRWRALGPPFAPDAQAKSFAVSNEGALFVGTSGPSGAELWRSADLGESWEAAALTTEPDVAPRVVGAYGDAETARVFVVLDSAQVEGLTTRSDRAVLSVDGGRTFSTLLEAAGDLSAWALSSNGAKLAIGGHADGIWVLQDAHEAEPSSVMRHVWERSVHALAWSAAGRLYAAGHEAVDGYSVGVSDDDGRSFRSVFALCQVQGPLVCAADTSVGAQCQSGGETGWDVRKEVADERACSEAEGPEPSSPEPANTQADPQSEAAPTAQAGCAMALSYGVDASSDAIALALCGALFALRSRRVRAVSPARCPSRKCRTF